MSDCIFCKIVAGEIPSTKVYEDEHVVAFRDINPAAPEHALVIPRTHVRGIDAAGREQPDVLGPVFAAVPKVADALGIAASGYRVVVNEGADAQQTVFHLHVHVLGGRGLKWPPG